MPHRPSTRFKSGAVRLTALTSLAAVIIGLAVFAPSAEAARGGVKGGGGGDTAVDSITLDVADPHLGDAVTFSYTLAKGGKAPRIAIVCNQSGYGVVWATDQAVGTSFVLGSTSSEWRANGGEAWCLVYLYRRNVVDGELARTYFTAGG